MREKLRPPLGARQYCKACYKPLRPYRHRGKDWAKDKEWGDYGDGYFCGLRCGYAFAIRIMELGK